MLREGTPVQDYFAEYGLDVKREDLACPPPGPPFSKTRGVYAHVKSRPEELIGVLDTFHSQAGHAVARACQILGKKCVNFYPRYKADGDTLREPQQRSSALGAELFPLQAGRSCILYHSARKEAERRGGYIMPNALKLTESVEETAREVSRTITPYTYTHVLVPASSGTIAAGVIRGFGQEPTYLVHLGYSRSHDGVRAYLLEKCQIRDANVVLIDEGYSYADKARAGEDPPWPCNPYYDLKAFRWWLREGRSLYGGAGRRTLLWNIG
jgi:hypothetical protein